MGSGISEIIGKINPKYKNGPVSEHVIGYDSATETLEPIYFFIVDLLNDVGMAPEKLIDNFSSSPGSGHFAELGQRATAMQNQATKVLGDINTVLRSVLNIIYDLKDFRMRLQSYDDANSDDKDKKEAAILSLKQIWMDKVDMQKGNSSIKAMALGQAGFVTLIDAFLAAKDEKDVSRLDINDRVKRILVPRVHEFYIWLKQSEQELRKRYELEKTYLRSQVNSLKLYSRWAKPYLKTAHDLEAKEGGRDAALVKTFNTIILELVLLGKQKVDVKSSALEGDLPREFTKESFLKKLKRNYYSCVVVEFRFRGIPQRVAQQSHFSFGGKAEVSFKSYALNDDELKKLNKELDESDLGEVLKLIKGTTEDSLEQLQDEINFFLEEKDVEKEEQKKSPRSSDQSNPFLALIGAYNKSEKPKKEKPKEKENDKIEKDSWIEATHLRPLAATMAKDMIFNLFDVYKKAHGMESFT